MLLPIAFITIVVISSFIFSYFSKLAEHRTNAAIQTDLFIQEVLKGRILVYQFLRAPDETKAQKVRDEFNILNNLVSELQSELTNKENINLCNEIINQSKVYINFFDKFAQNRITEHKNGIEKESPEMLAIIKQMVDVGLDLE